MKNIVKKISIDLTAENAEKLAQLIDETGFTKKEVVNRAIANLPVIGISMGPEIAKSFYIIREYMTSKECIDEIREEVDKVCQSFDLLMAEIVNFRN